MLKEITPEGSTTFGYNASGQLTHAANAQRSLQWEYDAAGQISADWQDDKVIRHHYNANGQRTSGQIEQSVHYAYDPLGRRISKQIAHHQASKAQHSKHTVFLWNGDVLLQETSVLENGEQQHRTYYFEPGTFKPIALNHNGRVYHYHLDHLGTPDTLTNEQGDIAWSVSYRSYGNVALAQVNDIGQPLRFQGQYFDEESGLHYNRFRYYDPRVGLFTQQDPIGLLGGINNYQYVPNPVHWVDPFGLTCKENSWNRFQKNTKGHFANSTEASESYQKVKAVQAMDKGTRPDPSTYLPQSYIDAHLAQFDGGASRFMTKANLEKCGPGQRDGTSFVMPSQEADNLMNIANGDPLALADSLGLPREMLDGNQLVRVDFSSSQELGLRMPSGNEAGANDLWLAGGKLPGGSSEAVIDAGGIPASRYTSNPVAD